MAAATTNGTLPLTTSTTTVITSSSIISTTSTPSTSSTPSSSSVISTTSTTPLPSSTSQSVILSTSIFTATPSASTLADGSVTTVYTTSTNVVTKTEPVPTSSTGSSSAATSGAAGLNTPSGQDSSSPNTTTIAVATVVPILVVALLALAGIWFWRRRKQRMNGEEMRRKEMEEYGFNPNNDPTLATVASTNGDEPSTMRERDAGYRGWGTTSNTHKASTTMSSNPGMARSDSGGRGGYNGQPSPPVGGQALNSDGHSGDPLVAGGLRRGDEIGALGAAPAASGNRGVHRGPSNASSAYSGANYSDVSAEGPLPGGSPQEYGGYMHPDEAIGTANYGDGGWAAQPVIKDVSARRNTHIENPSVIPHQGGIAQNF